MTKAFREFKSLDLPALETEVLGQWDEENTFNQSVEQRSGGPTFTFYEGPPTANGRPGIHHVLGRTIKDAFCRYKTLKGYRVERKGGWDTHGLPVEIEVEKELGLDGREEVETYGVAAFNTACRQSVSRYKRDWDELTRRIGYWVDLDDPYVTYHTEYIESVWTLIKRIHERGLLYRGHKIQWYSPGTGTVLSSHEVSLGYQEIIDPSVYVRFRSAADPTLSYLAWTTTPWTLISNVGLVVNRALDYVTVELDGEKLVLAEARLGVLDGDFEVIAKHKGEDLVGARYEPLYQVEGADYNDKCWQIYDADYVTVEDGSGLVHIAPAFGAEDSEVGARVGLPLVNPVTANGHFNSSAALVEGAWFKDANKVILKDLKSRGLLYRRLEYSHNYPHDWRKGTPLMSYPVDSWFVRTTAIKDRLVELNRTINWHPPGIRDGRFGNWLENNIDWALSRKRYWGTPLPVWVSDAAGSDYFEVVGSIAELREKCGDSLFPDEEIDLHRPYVDDLTWPAPDGGTMRRVADVLDVWFDSGAMPFAQWHYPFENVEGFERNFPADFICEGIDQTRGWFYTLHAIAALVEDSVAFKNVVVNGLVLDENGEKMSKSKGNTVNPFEVVERFGADVVRWYLMSNSPPWDSMKFSERGLTETRGKFFGTVENVYRFMASYANIDGVTCTEKSIPAQNRTELDQWILSRLQSTSRVADEAFEAYDCTRAARALEQFVDELSNWYIRRSRPRFWAAKKMGGSSEIPLESKLAAYQTTYECLAGLAVMMSPIAPFFSDWLFRNLNDVAGHSSQLSVHHENFPVCDDSMILPQLEHRMSLARQIVQLVLLLRNRSQINVRQPLTKILLVIGGDVERSAVELVKAIILEEVNVLEIDYIDDSSGVVKRSAKADFKKLGPRLGKDMKAVAGEIARLDDAAIQAFLSEGQMIFNIDGKTVDVSVEEIDVASEEIDDWSVAHENGVTVALDTRIDDALKSLGLAREVVSRVQSLRKKLDLELTDRINVYYRTPDDIKSAIDQHKAFIMSETLAVSFESFDDFPQGPPEIFEIGDQTLELSISVVQ